MREGSDPRRARALAAAGVALWVMTAAWAASGAPFRSPLSTWAELLLGSDGAAALGVARESARTAFNRSDAESASRTSPGDSPADLPGAAPERQEQRKRGIRPPWRENAIPELRNQPGRRERRLTA